MNLLLGVFFGILTMLAYGFAEIAETQAARKTVILRSNLWGWAIGSAMLLMIFLLVFHANLPSVSLFQAILAAVAGILGALGYLAFYKALRTGKASVIAPISNASAVITVVLSLILLGEKILLLQILGICLIICGSVLISVRKREAKTPAKAYSAGTKYALAVMVFWGLMLFIIGFLVREIGWFFPVFFSTVAAAITDLAIALSSRTNLAFPRAAARPVLIESILSTTGFLFYGLGANLAPIAIVAPIASASTFVTVVTARVFLRERPALPYMTSIAFLIAGLVLISI
jgi:transporter family protein